ncbi:MAG: dihydroxyacetone kinase subunit DhaK [Sphaerochaetaceae bacterium]
MKKFINEPKNFVDEMMEGILAAHPKQLTSLNEDIRCIVTTEAPVKEKVGIVTGGGSGHLPLFLGYVGKGLLDGCAVGGVFQSPSSDQILEITKRVNSGAGVLYIYGNYGGDIMNFDMAKDLAELEGIEVEQVIGKDDVTSAPKGEEYNRRGVAGLFFVYKCAGAMADKLAPLAEVKRIAEKAETNTRTMGVALSPNIVPEIGNFQFTIGDDEMEIGMGIHGEPGIRRGQIKPADSIVTEMVGHILEDMPLNSDDSVAVLVNSLGATPKEELYILYRKVHAILVEKGIEIFHVYIGEYATSLEMAGASISLLKLDEELKALISEPATTPFFEQVRL